MDKQQIYEHIEEKAKIRGNGKYIMGDDPKYEFEPGNTPIPKSLSIVYDSGADKGLISLDNDNKDFADHIKLELKNVTPRIYRTFNPNGSLIEIDNFKITYTEFADALDEAINVHRIFVPSLSKSNFVNEDMDEYTLKTNNGSLWIPAYVCNGAFYQITLASFDLSGFDNYKEIRDYADAMIRIHDNLTKNYFNVNIDNQGEHIDYKIKAEAVSKEKIRNDLEKIIE